MKKTVAQLGLFLILIVTITSCRFTQSCATYSQGNKKAKFKAVEKSHRHMARRVYTPGAIY